MLPAVSETPSVPAARPGKYRPPWPDQNFATVSTTPATAPHRMPPVAPDPLRQNPIYFANRIEGRRRVHFQRFAVIFEVVRLPRRFLLPVVNRNSRPLQSTQPTHPAPSHRAKRRHRVPRRPESAPRPSPRFRLRRPVLSARSNAAPSKNNIVNSKCSMGVPGSISPSAMFISGFSGSPPSASNKAPSTQPRPLHPD